MLFNLIRSKISGLNCPCIFLTCLLLLCGSCQKSKNEAIIPGQASVAIVHAAPGTPQLRWTINTSPLLKGSLTYGKAQSYLPVKEDNYDFKISKVGTDSALAGIILPLRRERFYSVFINGVRERLSIVWTEDDVSPPPADKVKIRFVNFSPDIGSVDLAIAGQITPLFQKVPFRTATDFITIAPAHTTVLEIRRHGSTEVLIRSENLELKSGNIYTVYANGLCKAADSTRVALALLNHK